MLGLDVSWCLDRSETTLCELFMCVQGFLWHVVQLARKIHHDLFLHLSVHVILFYLYALDSHWLHLILYQIFVKNDWTKWTHFILQWARRKRNMLSFAFLSRPTSLKLHIRSRELITPIFLMRHILNRSQWYKAFGKQSRMEITPW